MTPNRTNGIIDIPGHHSVDETVDKLNVPQVVQPADDSHKESPNYH